MSIYATVATLRVDGHMVYVQAVPGHIDYVGPEWEFLGPPVGEDEFRTVFVVDELARKIRQRYEYWLMQLSWHEYTAMSRAELRKRVRQAMRKHEPA